MRKFWVKTAKKIPRYLKTRLLPFLEWAPELRAEQGDELYADGCERGEAKLIGIREGLLLRSLVTAIKR